MHINSNRSNACVSSNHDMAYFFLCNKQNIMIPQRVSSTDGTAR